MAAAAAPPRLIVCRRPSAPHRPPTISSPRLSLRGSSSIAVETRFLRFPSSAADASSSAPTTMFLPRLFFGAATSAALPPPQIPPWRLLLLVAAAPSSPSLRRSPLPSCYSPLPGRCCRFRIPLPRYIISCFDTKILVMGTSLLPYYSRILPYGCIIMGYDSGLVQKLPVSILRSTSHSKAIFQPKPRTLKMGLFTVVTVIAGATYCFSAFTLDEIEEKTKALQALSKFSMPLSLKKLRHCSSYLRLKYTLIAVRKLDTKGNARYILGRNSTKYFKEKHSQGLSRLNRDHGHIIYISG